MSTSTVRWIGVLVLGLVGVAVLVYLLGRYGPSGSPPGPASRARERRARPARADLPAAPGPLARGPTRAAPPARPLPGEPPLADAGVTAPDRFAPPEDRFTLHPRMQTRLADMGVNERRIWTTRLIGNLESRVKEVEARIAQHEAAGDAKAAHGERISLGRITDGIAALKRQLTRIEGVLQGRSSPDAGSP